MPKKYQKPNNKNRRYTHNRPYYGCWWETDKETRKAARKSMKALRHKLLFHIPLTEEEEAMVKRTGVTADCALDREGHVCNERKYIKNEDGKFFFETIPNTGKTERWSFLNPKEMREKYGKPKKRVDKNK